MTQPQQQENGSQGSTFSDSVAPHVTAQTSRASRWDSWPVWLALTIGLGFSLWVLKSTLNLPLMDQHDFRQTQTAISAYWLTQHFSLFNYETPVLGMPWSIPFEFPTYQVLVALLWKLFPSLSLDAAARLVSWGAWAACAYPMHRIMMRYFRDVAASGILLCLFFSSPFSVFWARTAMIETTALLCSLMFLWELIRLGDAPAWRPALFATFWGVLAILTKVTTIPPFMLAGGLHILYMQRRAIFSVWKLVTPPFVLCVVALVLWTHHADAVKSENTVGSFLTSGSISWWNFGTLSQKLNFSLWYDMLSRNLRELYGSEAVFVASCTPILMCSRRYLLYALYALLLFMVPMLLFTNLYAVHNYYQTANMVFMLAFTAIPIYGAEKRLFKNLAYLPTLVLTIVFVLLFQSVYGPSLHYATTSPTLTVARVLKMLTNPNDVVAVFGDDWNSATLYYAQRRGFMYPWWIEAADMTTTLEHLPQRLGAEPAAVVHYFRPSPPYDGNPRKLTWTTDAHLQNLAQMGTAFPAMLAGMRKVRVADALVYYKDRPESVVSLLDKPQTSVSPQTTIRSENDTLVVTAKNSDPFVQVPVTLQPDKKYLVRLRIQGPKGFAQLFYSTATGGFSEANSVVVNTGPDMEMLIPLPADVRGPELRLDPGNHPGEYIISEFVLLEVGDALQ